MQIRENARGDFENNREPRMIDFGKLSHSLGSVETPRLTFRPALAVDGWGLYDATKHESFNRYLSWSRPSDPYLAVARMEAISEAHRRGEMCAISAIHRENGRWVALFRFLRYRLDPRIVEISLWIHSDFHHDSMGWEITRTLVDKGFENSEMPLMLAASCQENRPAQRLLLSCGFTYHSLVPRPHEDGFPLPLFEYRQTREEWERTLANRRVIQPIPAPTEVALRHGSGAANRSRYQEVSGK